MKVKYVTTRATQFPQFELFDVSFPEKLLKIVATIIIIIIIIIITLIKQFDKNAIIQ